MSGLSGGCAHREKSDFCHLTIILIARYFFYLIEWENHSSPTPKKSDGRVSEEAALNEKSGKPIRNVLSLSAALGGLAVGDI